MWASMVSRPSMYMSCSSCAQDSHASYGSSFRCISLAPFRPLLRSGCTRCSTSLLSGERWRGRLSGGLVVFALPEKLAPLVVIPG